MLYEQCVNNLFSHEELDDQYLKSFARMHQLQIAMAAGDRLALFRDALMTARKHHLQSPDLPCETKFSADVLRIFGLNQNADLKISIENERLVPELVVDQIYRKKTKRMLAQCPIDVQVKNILPDEFSNYNGAAQRMAVWCALALEKAQRHHNFFVNLPTGCGKTLIPHTLALNPWRKAKTIVVIAPTVSLILDLELRTREILSNKDSKLDHGGSYKWDGSTDDNEKAEIKKRMNSGTQRIIFLTPETFSNQRNTFFHLVKKGLLGTIFIDEAHMVVHWGTNFRPHFQITATLINSLRNESHDPLHCVLLSATINENIFNQLSGIFDGPNVSKINLNGSFLRPEIAYKTLKVNDADEHFELVLKSIVQLPKPLIVYCTKREQARKIKDAIRTRLQIKRVEQFDGDTSAKNRERILAIWKAEEINVIVATSAFGLGVDKANVRSILHAEVPENIDRFYQEVGRGGRDGCSSQSLIIFTPYHFKVARRLNHNSRIGPKLGHARWKTMWTGGDDTFSPPVISCGRMHPGITNDTKKNISWNWRTLTLMQRAGLVELQLKPYKNLDETNTEVDGDPIFQDAVQVKFLKDNPLDPAHWTEINQVKAHEAILENSGFETLATWLNNDDEIKLCKSLKWYYTYDSRSPSFACGGCPACRPRIARNLGKHYRLSTAKSRTDERPAIDNQLYYFENRDYKTLLKKIGPSLQRFLNNTHLTTLIVANEDVLESIPIESKRLKNIFWLSCTLPEFYGLRKNLPLNLFQVLIITMYGDEISFSELATNSPVVHLLQAEIKDPHQSLRNWWEANENAMSIDSWKVN